MSRDNRIRVTAAVCVLILVCVDGAVAQLSLEQPGLSPIEIVRAEVTPRLQAWKRHFSALRIEFQQRQVDERGQPIDAKVEYSEWRYSRLQQSWYHRWIEDEGRVVSRLLEIVGRDRSDVVLYPDGPSELHSPQEIRRFLQPPAHRADGVLPMRGLWFGERDQWLPDLLTEIPMRSLEWGSINDRRCLVLPISARNIDDGEWYLDPETNYLPRGFSDGRETYIVAEHRKTPPGVLMPWQGSREVYGEAPDEPVRYYRWEVTSIELDPEFAADDFEIPSEPLLGGLIGRMAAEDPPLPAHDNNRSSADDTGWFAQLRPLGWWAAAALIMFGATVAGIVWRRRRKHGATTV